MVPEALPGTSKSGAAANARAPAASIVNNAASAPDNAIVTVSPELQPATPAATVPTAVEFSATLNVADEVNVTASLEES